METQLRFLSKPVRTMDHSYLTKVILNVMFWTSLGKQLMNLVMTVDDCG